MDALTDAGVVGGDRDLWARAGAGEYDAFGELFDRHARTVYNFLFRQTASWSDAEDLTSAVFLHAWRRRQEIVLDRDSALPWLLKVADYCARNQRRSLRRYRQALERLQIPRDEAPDHADAVASRVDDERTMAKVRDALRRLPKQERDVVELCVCTGLDQRAAATALGVPVRTVKARITRARRQLQRLLVPTSSV
jgi:RNA polymerase sigma factor (sigma-70 family)